MNENEIKNRRILIKNIEDGQIIADTKINRFDSLTNSVYISADSLKERKQCEISAFIFAERCLYELFGTIKSALVDNEIEVLLGKNKEKEDRVKTRYPVTLKGKIVCIMIEGQMIKLRKAMDIQTVNMSANGILIKAVSGSFGIGDCFSLDIKAEGVTMQLVCEIVRIQNSNMQSEEYGCRISEIWIEGEMLQENKK